MSDAVYKVIEGDENADIIYRIVMGVLEKNNELDFKLSKLVDKRPKSAICIVLKQGIYCLYPKVRIFHWMRKKNT